VPEVGPGVGKVTMKSVDGDEGQGHCHGVLEAMYLFLDDEELTPEQRLHVQAHLDDCIPCLEAFEFEAEFKSVIAKRCRDEVPTQLYEKVRLLLSGEISDMCATKASPPLAPKLDPRNGE
jgi:mycothiol system anti-sigma-R factor